MHEGPDFIGELVIDLVPSLAESVEQSFTIFDVLRHGTHEKQLSNVFAWLLDSHGSHGLGNVAQEVLVGIINEKLASTGSERLPWGEYRVIQEVNTADEGTPSDIADIVLVSASAAVVIENYYTSDGHGHDYYGYLRYGQRENRQSVVVLLCAEEDRARQSGGWDEATVVTYAALLEPLLERTRHDSSWAVAHPAQSFLINQLVERFVKGPAAVSIEDQIAFVDAMCRSGEAKRYGLVPHAAAEEEFAEALRLRALRHFAESRTLLGRVKERLSAFAQNDLSRQLKSSLGEAGNYDVMTNFSGVWQWSVNIGGGGADRLGSLVFGPSADAQNREVPEPLENPDFTKVFVLVKAGQGAETSRLIQTEVTLAEVIAGLESHDFRFRDVFLAAVGA